MIVKSDLSKFIKDNGIKQRGDDILNILEHYKDVENLYLENYENVAYRNLNLLKENGITIKESELGLKFEDLTKTIFKNLGFDVDDSFKNKLNTKKDMIKWSEIIIPNSLRVNSSNLIKEFLLR